VSGEEFAGDKAQTAQWPTVNEETIDDRTESSRLTLCLFCGRLCITVVASLGDHWQRSDSNVVAVEMLEKFVAFFLLMWAYECRPLSAKTVLPQRMTPRAFWISCSAACPSPSVTWSYFISAL
jgi:hypothetical protein